MDIEKIKNMVEKNNGWFGSGSSTKLCLKVEKIGRKWVHVYDLLHATPAKYLIADFCTLIEENI